MKLMQIKNENLEVFKNTIREYQEIDWTTTFIYEIIENDNLVGFIGLDRFEENTICITCIYVLPEYRNKGYGLKAINKIISSNKKCDLIFGFVNVNNRDVNFYKRHWNFLNKERTGITKIVENAHYVEDFDSYEIHFYEKTR